MIRSLDMCIDGTMSKVRGNDVHTTQNIQGVVVGAYDYIQHAWNYAQKIDIYQRRKVAYYMNFSYTDFVA